MAAAAAALVASCVALSVKTSSPAWTVPPHFATFNVDTSRDRLFFDNDALFYSVGAGAPPCAPTEPFVRECLNVTLGANLFALAAAAGAQMVFGLNIHPATGQPSPPKGPWDPTNARVLLTENQRRGSPIQYLEVGNEQNTEMTAVQQAAALRVLSGLLDELYGLAGAGRPHLVGPDTHSVHDAGSPNSAVLAYLAAFTTATADIKLHAVTHHEYIEIDYKNVLNATFLDTSAGLAKQVMAAVRAVSSSVEVWAGAIGPHNGGGGNNSAPTNCADNRVCGRFGSALWYADSLAAKALAGYALYCRQDLIGADYALLNATASAVMGAWSYQPTPDFFVLQLWHVLVSGAVGSSANVLAVVVGDGAPGASTRAYAYCAARGATSVTLLLLNLDAAPACVTTPAWATAGAPLTLYSLTPGTGDSPVESHDAMLNGVLLRLDANGHVPALTGVPIDASAGITLAPISVSFVVVPFAQGAVPACA